MDEVYTGIVDELAERAGRDGSIVYAVPGSPVVAERTVEMLSADGRIEVVVHPALSFLDLTWARLRVDPVELGVRLVDGHRFGVEAAGQRGPLLVAQCESRFVLSDVKLSVDEPPAEPVVVLQRLGLPDERIVEVDWADLDRSVEPDHLTSLWIPQLVSPVASEVAGFAELMRALRVSDPWKAEQTHDSLKRFLLEESYEVLEAIDAFDPDTGEGAEALEEELGRKLFTRGKYEVSLTESGLAFKNRAVEIVDMAERTKAEFAPKQIMAKGTVYIGGGETRAMSYLANIAAATRRAYPQISLVQVRDVIIPLPSIDEQEKISTVLTSADKEIEALQRELNALRKVRISHMAREHLLVTH